MSSNEKFSKEFRDFAVKHQGISSLAFDKYVETVTNLTPNIIEERRMNAVAMDVFSRLMMDRIIFLGVPIDDYVSNVVIAQLLFLESVDSKKDILLYINSPGGSVYAGLGIYDTMQLVKPDVATICTGLAASMGAVLLAGGTRGKRAALQHARIMIHQPMGGAGGQASDIEITARHILELKEELHRILAEHTGKSIEQIEQDSDRDFWMKAEQAVEYGIIDEVLGKRS
ncbi:ATP-dependent Clp protease protease subunit [Thermonema lapsum]|jgi:ATP-dependent Clp protease protease subunit|uniref:ATP-dependent Clp protease proteolytic subunit n=1 Tax=Thermonema lapsum TaxID=28195 RepID=A0A846MRT0_9BACT|nr:ATP-dependent Clp protease proteolytic subunit [Thermonema lapsum]NIK74060.1 ATP-dependent Clp protease protease subunit [Thermonema lapsum]